MRIHTVTGTVDSADLGYTLMHEHAVTCCDWSMRMGLRSQFCEDGRLLEMAVTQLKRARAAGIDTIVDGTPINLGRDIRLIREAALQSGMNIIVSSGFYHQQDPWLEWKPYEEILGYLDYECAHGLEETDVLPGIMKCAVDYRGITDYIVKMLGVTADCAVKHRIPIFCHTIPELKHGGAMLDIMADHGVPMRAVIAGHSGDVDDIDYLESVLTYLNNAEDVDAIDALRSELVETGYMRRRRQAGGYKEKKYKPSPLKYVTSEGFHVLVGRNNKENDILTLKTAGKNDLWLHTKDIPGSHVIVQMEGRELTETLVYEAAAIAAYHSKARNSENVPVDYVEVKYVKKPAGAKPGMVIFTNNRTVWINPKRPT